MSYVRINGADLFFGEFGAREETVVLAHGLLGCSRMFTRQIDDLKTEYRCIAFDFRGHGGSEVTKEGYDLESHTRDAAAVIGKLARGPCHFLGFSMGGWVGMNVALRHPGLVKSLILVNTTADAETLINIVKYGALRLAARSFGFSLAAAIAVKTMFGPRFARDPSTAAIRDEWKRRLLASNRLGVARAVGGVMARKSLYERLHRIDVPTLVIASAKDIVTPPVHSARIHARISGSRLHLIGDTGHTSPIEAAEIVSGTVRKFLYDVCNRGGGRRVAASTQR
jgi:pimeloyl-ACP methyl ester carboxylesterase